MAKIALWLGIVVYVLTMSRTGWVVLLLFVLYRWLLKPALEGPSILRPVLSAVALIIGGLLIYQLLVFGISLNPYSLDNRLRYATGSLREIAARPTLGFGMAGHARYVVFTEARGWFVSGRSEHNTFLWLATRAGLPALLFFGILILFVLWRARSMQDSHRGFILCINDILLQSFVLQLIYMLFLSALFRKDTWFVMAMLTVIPQVGGSDRVKKEEAIQCALCS